MTIKPILFNTEMVRAILDGRKTCTRRICKDANEYTVPDMEFYNADKRTYAVHNFADKEQMEQLSTAERTCPICPGDILYVRETWEHFDCCCCEGDEHGNCYQEPQQNVLNKSYGCYMYRATDEIYGDARWHPSIHMPKEAARIWLKVTDVRIERLQDVTEDGAKAEGAIDNRGFIHSPENEYDRIHTAREHFIKIWNSTIKKSDIDRYGWDANPYVWVISFERCEKPEGV
nr:MAG TPA: ASCH domain protein [Caudoviricetes sp.]